MIQENLNRIILRLSSSSKINVRNMKETAGMLRSEQCVCVFGTWQLQLWHRLTSSGAAVETRASCWGWRTRARPHVLPSPSIRCSWRPWRITGITQPWLSKRTASGQPWTTGSTISSAGQLPRASSRFVCVQIQFSFCVHTGVYKKNKTVRAA